MNHLSLSLSFSGLLQKEQDSAVVYGSIDTGKTVFTHDKFQELVSKFSFVAHYLLSYTLHTPSLHDINGLLVLSVCPSLILLQLKKTANDFHTKEHK